MTSNKDGTLEQNVEHLTTNILTYYTHEMEQYAASYDAMSMTTLCNKSQGLGRKLPRGKVDGGVPGRACRLDEIPMDLVPPGRILPEWNSGELEEDRRGRG